MTGKKLAKIVVGTIVLADGVLSVFRTSSLNR